MTGSTVYYIHRWYVQLSVSSGPPWLTISVELVQLATRARFVLLRFLCALITQVDRSTLPDSVVHLQ